jgi:hypothetical protein
MARLQQDLRPGVANREIRRLRRRLVMISRRQELVPST